MSNRPALHDPDDWYNRWNNLHHSDLFAGQLAGLALSKISEAGDGMGREQLEFQELDGRAIEVEVVYALESHPNDDDVTVFHVLSILSPGDPLPPFLS